MRRWVYPLALVALCGLLLFWRLGVTPLDDFDEAYYAEGAREMLERGDLGTPYYNGQPFLLKPILIYWLIAGAFRVFGVTEFAARSVSAFFATVIVLAVYWFGRRAINSRAGFMAGVALALCYMWVDTGREAMIDMPLTAALAPAMFLFFLGTRRVAQASACDARDVGRLKPALPYFPAYALLGLALLAKGPAGTVPSLVGLLGYLVWSRTLTRTLREAYLLPGIALTLAVAVPWYAYEGIRQPGFLQTFLVREHFGHLQGELAREDAWWGHLKNLVVGFFPWVVFLPAALVSAFRRNSGNAALKFSAWWAVAVVVIFSSAGAKLPHYLVPAFPPMALLVAAWFDRWLGEECRQEAKPMPYGALGALGLVGLLLAALAGIAALMPPVVRDRIAAQFGSWTPGPAPVVMLTALAAGSLGAAAAALARRRGVVFPMLASAMLVALLAHVGWFKPRLSLIQSQPRKELAQLAGVVLPADEPLGVFYAKRNAIIFYARRPIVDLGEWEPEKLVAFLSSPTPTTALTHARFLPLLERDAPRAQLWTRRGDFVLVSNHRLDIFGRRREGALRPPTTAGNGP
jgi:4-amino-4-deoxy-L-arabinose transferase-like glycosyltransferase